MEEANMSYTVDRYKVFFKDTPVGEYRVTSDGNAVYQAGYDLSEEISAWRSTEGTL